MRSLIVIQDALKYTKRLSYLLLPLLCWERLNKQNKKKKEIEISFLTTKSYLTQNKVTRQICICKKCSINSRLFKVMKETVTHFMHLFLLLTFFFIVRCKCICAAKCQTYVYTIYKWTSRRILPASSLSSSDSSEKEKDYVTCIGRIGC